MCWIFFGIFNIWFICVVVINQGFIEFIWILFLFQFMVRYLVIWFIVVFDIVQMFVVYIILVLLVIEVMFMIFGFFFFNRSGCSWILRLKAVFMLMFIICCRFLKVVFRVGFWMLVFMLLIRIFSLFQSEVVCFMMVICFFFLFIFVIILNVLQFFCWQFFLVLWIRFFEWARNSILVFRVRNFFVVVFLMFLLVLVMIVVFFLSV